jgi:chromosome segregation ATPase
MYEEQLQSIAEERNALVEQQILHLAETQREIEQLQEELAQLKQTSVTSHADISSNEDVKSLQEVIQQQSKELRDLSEKYFAALSQIEAQDELDQRKKETDERLHHYENQIEHLIRENAKLLEEVQSNTSSSVQSIDNESQTDDQQHDKLVQMNNKLKRALQMLKDKIHRLVTERPELFVNIGEETTERLDHLISTVEHQATQIDLLQTERNELQK